MTTRPKNNHRKIVLCIFIGLIALISLALNIVLFDKAVSFYKKINLLRLDPLEKKMLQSVSADAARDHQERLMILFGDSRIAKWHPMPELPGWKVINRGIKGQTTGQLLLRFKEDVLSHSPDALVVQAGINDLKTIGLFPGSRAEIVADCRENLLKLIHEAAAENIPVVVLTIFPVGKPGLIRSLFWAKEIDAAIIQINDELKSIHKADTLVIDSEEVLGDGASYLRNEFKKDLLHLNRRGYERLNEMAKSELYNFVNR